MVHGFEPRPEEDVEQLPSVRRAVDRESSVSASSQLCEKPVDWQKRGHKLFSSLTTLRKLTPIGLIKIYSNF